MSYTWACAINSTKSSSETPYYNEYCKRCHTNKQELSGSRGFEVLSVYGALPVPGGGFGHRLISESSPVILPSPLLFLQPGQNDQISSNQLLGFCVSTLAE